MSKDIEPHDFEGNIQVEVMSHGKLTTGYFFNRNRLNVWLAKPTVLVSGAPHLNEGQVTTVSLNQGTVGDYVDLVRGIYPNANVSLKNDQGYAGSKQALKDGTFFDE